MVLNMFNSMGLSSTGEVYTWEYLQGPEDNALLTPPACKRALDGKNVVDIACGGNVRDASDVYLALTDKGEVYSWGAGDFRRPLVSPAEHKNRMPRVIDQLRVCNVYLQKSCKYFNRWIIHSKVGRI